MELFRFSRLPVAIIVVVTISVAATAGSANDRSVAIRSDYAGGNVKVTHNDGNTIRVAPDLRGDRPRVLLVFRGDSVETGTSSLCVSEKSDRLPRRCDWISGTRDQLRRRRDMEVDEDREYRRQFDYL